MLALPQQEGYPNTRTFLLFSHDEFTRQVARVTLARGLPSLPCKRSARDNLPTRVNFLPSCVTSNRTNLNGIIQFLSLIINT